jgi:hypothetical protein
MKRANILVSALLAGLVLSGCAKPPQVSPGNRKLVDGLRTATSSKQIAWVDECAKLLEECQRKGTVKDEEYEEFNAIIALARDEKWQEAEAEAIRLGKAQRPTPEDLARLRRAKGQKPDN